MYIYICVCVCVFSILNTKQTSDGIFSNKAGEYFIWFGKNFLESDSLTMKNVFRIGRTQSKQ